MSIPELLSKARKARNRGVKRVHLLIGVDELVKLLEALQKCKAPDSAKHLEKAKLGFFIIFKGEHNERSN